MIITKRGYAFDGLEKGKKLHLFERGLSTPVCGSGMRIIATPQARTDEPEVCKNCLKIARKRGLIEEVDDQKQAEMSDNEASSAQVSDKELEEVTRERDHFMELVCRLERAVVELKDKLGSSQDASASWRRVCEDLEAEVVELKKERDYYLSEAENAQTGCVDYCDATNGHKLEHIKVMMQAMPTVEELEGYELRWGLPKKGESFVEALKGQTLWSVATSDFDNPMARWLIRTPFVEYIPTEEITDELVAELGRIPCEVWSGMSKDKHSQTLVAVVDGAYRTREKYTLPWKHCRIKQSTIDKLKKPFDDFIPENTHGSLGEWQ